MKMKKSLLWVLIALVVILAGVGAYYYLIKNKSSASTTGTGTITGTISYQNGWSCQAYRGYGFYVVVYDLAPQSSYNQVNIIGRNDQNFPSTCTYKFTNVPAGNHAISVRTFAGGLSSVNSYLDGVYSDSGVRTKDISLPMMMKLTGKVTKADGTPYVSAKVAVLDPAFSSEWNFDLKIGESYVVNTDSKGVYAMAFPQSINRPIFDIVIGDANGSKIKTLKDVNLTPPRPVTTVNIPL